MQQIKIIKWLLDNRTLIGFGLLVLAVGGLLAFIKVQRADIKDYKAKITDLEATVKEAENAMTQLEGKADYEVQRNDIARDSARAVAAGRQTGDGALAPVLRGEYERVYSILKKARD